MAEHGRWQNIGGAGASPAGPTVDPPATKKWTCGPSEVGATTGSMDVRGGTADSSYGDGLVRSISPAGSTPAGSTAEPQAPTAARIGRVDGKRTCGPERFGANVEASTAEWSERHDGTAGARSCTEGSSVDVEGGPPARHGRAAPHPHLWSYPRAHAGHGGGLGCLLRGTPAAAGSTPASSTDAPTISTALGAGRRQTGRPSPICTDCTEADRVATGPCWPTHGAGQ